MRNDDSRIIPRFIKSRDEYARRQGFDAHSAVRNDEEGTPFIESTWRGPESAFRSIGVLRPRQHAPIRCLSDITTRDSDRRRGLRVFKAWDEGRLYLRPDGSLQLVVINDVPTGIDMLAGDIERCTFPANWRHARRLALHGTEGDLRSSNVLPYPSGRPWRKGVRAGTGWRAELQPDCSVVYWLLEERHAPEYIVRKAFASAAARDTPFQSFMRRLGI